MSGNSLIHPGRNRRRFQRRIQRLGRRLRRIHRRLAMTGLRYLRGDRGLNFPLMGLQHHPPRDWDTPAPSPSIRPVVSMVGLPVISIVTPSYNQASMLERTIRSVLDQGYPRLQFVIQDGGSTDHSVEIIRRYEMHLHAWESAPDEGQAHAIETGFSRTDGQIMGWLNSDDILLPGALWEIARTYQQNPDVDVVYGHRLIIDEQDRQVGRWMLPSNTHHYLKFADYLGQESVYWRRELWDRVHGIDRSFQFAMDWDLFLRFQRAGGRFHRIPRFLGGFRIHRNQKTSACLENLGTREMNRLRKRELGHLPENRELAEQLVWLYWRNLAMDSAQRLGLSRAA